MLELSCKLKIKLENKKPPPCLDKAYLFEVKENETREWGAKWNKITKLGVGCT